MSNGDEPLGSDASRPAFATVVRGYDKRQVDHYVSRLEGEHAQLAAEHQRAFRQIQDMGAHIREVSGELTELRQQPRQLERASFRDLGPMVDQILALAEKQADAITTAAAQKGAEHQADAEKALGEARDLAEKLRADGAAAHEKSEQEAKRVDELAAQRAEQARQEAEALVEAARMQAQKELETARQQTQQEIAQWREAVEQELGAQRTAANEKNVALHAEAQQYTTDLRRKAEEAAAAQHQQLMVVQKETEARRDALTQLEAELTAAQQQLGQVRQESTAAKRELSQVQHQHTEVSQSLSGELERLEQARRAAESAERHAKDVRARVQREAERVASMAAAAVMAAAQRGAETGEYPQVVANVNGLLANEGLAPPPLEGLTPVSPAAAPVSPGPVGSAPVSPAPAGSAPLADVPPFEELRRPERRTEQSGEQPPVRRGGSLFERPGGEQRRGDERRGEERSGEERGTQLPRREPDQLRREIEQEAAEAAIPMQRGPQTPPAQRPDRADEPDRIPADAE